MCKIKLMQLCIYREPPGCALCAKRPRVNLAPQLDRSHCPFLNLARPSCQHPTESVLSGFRSQSASFYIEYSEAGGARARSDCSGLLWEKKNMEEGRQEEATSSCC